MSTLALMRRAFDASILMLLLLSVLVGLAPDLDTRAVQLGEGVWPGYAANLRTEPVLLDCEPEALARQRSACSEAPLPALSADPFAPSAAVAAPSCAALDNLRADCERKHASYHKAREQITPAVRAFRALEGALRELAQFPYHKHLLVLLVVLGGLSATARGRHIALREPTTTLEIRTAEGAQLVVHLAWMASCLAELSIQRASAAEADHPMLPVLWVAGFAALSAVNVAHLLQARLADRGPPQWARLALVVPLYAYMAMGSALWFWLVERHPSGPAIFLHKFVQLPQVYTGIGLYIWSGMLLSQTRVARLVFGVIRPWRLPPALLGWLVIVLGAWSVAYSGASGVLVLATGAVVFDQMRAAGASRPMATAVTAMSGSLGVVLRPCLVVVLISILDPQVSTDELFGWGRWVFLLTATLSLVAFLLWNPDPIRVAPLPEALAGTRRALGPLLPYVGITLGVLALYRLLLGLRLDEHSAAFILPAMLLAMLVWDQRGEQTPGLAGALGLATRRCGTHVGALLLMMCGSVGLGGVAERSEVVLRLPHDLGSPFAAISVIMVVLVLIGMAMDELGSVVLVSVTLLPVALENGIAPVHFWMVVLVGFELGYLVPPVALNQLLTRQVVGREAHVEGLSTHSHTLVPVAILGSALVLVAYGPLLWSELRAFALGV